MSLFTSTLTLVALSLILTNSKVEADSFTATGSLNEGRAGHEAALLNNGTVLVAGCFSSGGPNITSTEIYNPATETWTYTGNLNVSRAGHTMTLLPNGNVLAAGGAADTSASNELYNPSSGTWSYTAATSQARLSHTATLLPNGKVLVAGGRDYWGTIGTYAELYNPATGTWSATGTMVDPRWGHTATLLQNGKVLVEGGHDANGYTQTAEIYDPATGLWTATGSTLSYREWHTATLLPNGKVLLAGGNVNNTELYDPATGTWSFTGSMAVYRGDCATSLLPNGKVLATGGDYWDTSGELYNPVTGTWTLAGNMTGVRNDHTSTVLPNGKVLLAGGWDGYRIPTAELYSGAMNVIVVSTSAVSPGITNGRYNALGDPAINSAGNVAFQATVTGTGITSTNNSGIWANGQLIARTGTGVAPGTNGNSFKTLYDPVYSDAGKVAFRALLIQGVDGTTSTNDLGIWSDASGALALIAREGFPAPGTAAGTTFLALSQFGLPAQGGVVLLATLQGANVTTTTNQGIWAVDTYGVLQLIVRKGDVVNGKVVKTLAFLPALTAISGQTRGFSQATGDLVYDAGFTDSTHAIIKVVFP